MLSPLKKKPHRQEESRNDSDVETFNGLHIGHIYDNVENHNTRNKSVSTATIIQATREHLLYKRPLLSSTYGGNSVSLPSMSRSSTRLDSEYVSQRAPSAKTLDCRTLQVALTRTGAISPNVCMRAQSAVDRQIEDVVRPLSRHCCDVLGPRTCHQCNQIARQEKDSAKHESKYPLLHVSSDNVTTTIIAERYMPEMSPFQIQHKIGSGEISKPAFHDRFIRAKALSDHRRAKQRENNKKKVARFLTKRRESTYFTNIRDLNDKIVHGEVSGKVSLRALLGQNPDVKKRPITTSFTEQLCPLFVSLKKINEPKRPAYIAYYEPPLLPKVCQNAEPAFFAGSDRKYELPERLPEDLGSREPVEV